MVTCDRCRQRIRSYYECDNCRCIICEDCIDRVGLECPKCREGTLRG